MKQFLINIYKIINEFLNLIIKILLVIILAMSTVYILFQLDIFKDKYACFRYGIKNDQCLDYIMIENSIN